MWRGSGRKNRTCTAHTRRIRGTYGAHSHAQTARQRGATGQDVASATSWSAANLRIHLPKKMNFGAWGRLLHRRPVPQAQMATNKEDSGGSANVERRICAAAIIHSIFIHFVLEIK